MHLLKILLLLKIFCEQHWPRKFLPSHSFSYRFMKMKKNSCREDAGLKVLGSNPGACNGCFSCGISIEAYLYNYISLGFAHYIGKSEWYDVLVCRCTLN